MVCSAEQGHIMKLTSAHLVCPAADWCCAVCCFVLIINFITQPEELEAVRGAALAAGASEAVVTRHHALGGAGAVDLAEAIVRTCSKPARFKFLYELDLPIKVWKHQWDDRAAP
jgi:formyltetrahydrofolate synthetase